MKKKRLRSTADQLWIISCVKKWGQNCGSCGKHSGQVHHFFPKGAFGMLRYEIDNGVPLCVSCHMGIHFSGNPMINEVIKENRGNKWFKSLIEKSKQKAISITTVGWYKDNIEKLTKFLEE